jgi:hypothetical protein
VAKTNAVRVLDGLGVRDLQRNLDIGRDERATNLAGSRRLHPCRQSYGRTYCKGETAPDEVICSSAQLVLCL